MENHSYLLANASIVSSKANEFWSYNNEIEMNTTVIHQKEIPVCMLSTAITCSKTEAAPGDDDPDPDTEFMY